MKTETKNDRQAKVLSKDTCVVIDAGGRYGIHPTWSDYKAPLWYCCFEPDPHEAKRLYKKYEDATDRVHVECCALAEAPSTVKLHRLRHQAASGFYRPIEGSIWFEYERPGEGDILETFDVPAITVDHFCDRTSLAADFLKLDTEGSELRILQGAEAQLQNSILGVRSEVSFDTTYEGQALFHEIHAFLLDRDFFLVNLDYDGRGIRRNDYVDDKRFGTLLDSDGVWVRRPEKVLEAATHRPESVFKFAAFCLANHAPDLGIETLIKFQERSEDSYWGQKETGLFQFLTTIVEDHFYNIRNLPGRKMDQISPLFQALFDRPIRRMQEYHQSPD